MQSQKAQHTESYLAVQVAQLRSEKSLAETHARELAEELQQKKFEMDDLEKVFSESMALQRRDGPGIGSNAAGGMERGKQLPGGSQEGITAPAGSHIVGRTFS